MSHTLDSNTFVNGRKKQQNLSKQIKMYRGSLWCSKHFILPGTSKTPQQGAETNKQDANYSSLVETGIKISKSAITGSDQKDYTIYRSMNKFKIFEKLAYIQKRNDESIKSRVRKILSEYHVIFSTKPIVEELATFDEHQNCSDQFYLCAS